MPPSKRIRGAGRQRLFDRCSFRFYSDISSGEVAEYLDGSRQATEDKRGISAQTFNFFLQAVRQFCRWMVKDRCAAEDSLAHLDGLNVKTDRHNDRRALSGNELR